MAAAVPLVFGAVGAWLAPTGYAALGFSIGSSIGSLLVPQPGMEGPRLNDLTVQSSTYGVAIPRVYGAVRIAGNLIWTSGIREHKKEEGGKGGPTYTSYSYTASWAVALCEGEMTGVTRIWFDTDLVYDVSTGADPDSYPATVKFADKFTFYPGSETQSADPLMVAAEGSGNVPAYRGIAYLVFDDLNIDKYGRIPNVTVEIGYGGTIYWTDAGQTRLLMYFDGADGATTTSDVIEHACALAHSHTPYTAEIDTAKSVSGGASLKLADYGYLEVTESVDPLRAMAFGSDDFLIEYRVWQVQPVQTMFHWVKCANPLATYPDGWYIEYTSAGNLHFICGDGTQVKSLLISGTGFAGAWHHVVIQRQGDTLSAWKDGILVHQETISFAIGGSTDNLRFGHNYSRPLSVYFDGWLDAARIMVGATRYDGATITAEDLYAYEASAFSNQVRVSSIVDDVIGLVSDAVPDTADIDFYLLDGYSVSRQCAARAALQPLLDAYLFDLVERDGGLVCVARGGASAATIAESALAAVEPGQEAEALVLRRAQETELPRRLVVHYADIDRDHQQNAQPASRLATQAVSTVDYEIPIVTTADHMAQVAEVLLYEAWIRRTTATFNVAAETYYGLGPADIVTVSQGADTYRLRLTKVDYQLPGLLRCEASLDDADVYLSSATGQTGTVPGQVVRGQGATVGEWIDSPLLDDTHDPAGIYLAVGSDGDRWSGGAAMLSLDGGITYVTVATFPSACVLGTTSTTLADADTHIMDRAHTVRVALANSLDELESVTELQALGGANACLIGNEVVSFQTATLVSTGVYDLSNLVRGRRGTEWATGTHTASDRFVLLDGRLRRAAISPAHIGTPISVKYVQSGETLAAATADTGTYLGRAYYPYAPAHLAATDNGDGTWDVAWVRRDRLDGEWRDSVETPLSEASEAYRVQVYNGATQVSTADVSIQSATVTASAGYTVKVYQLSATTGPGFVSEITL